MSNVIQFLETLGSKPMLSPADYAATVAVLELDTEQQEALLDRDHARLNDLLGGREKLLCSVFPATPDDDQKDDDEKREDDVPVEDIPPESE